MSKISTWPFTPHNMSDDRFTRSESTPHVSVMRELGQYQNFVAARMKKMVWCKSYPVTNTPTSSPGITQRIESFTFRSGLQSRDLKIMCLLPPGSASSTGTARKISFELTDETGNTATETATNPLSDTTSPIVPSKSSDCMTRAVSIPISPDTVYSCRMLSSNGARLWSACAWEVSSNIVDDTERGSSNPSNFCEGAPIRNDETQKLFEQSGDVWSHNAGHLVQFSPFQGYTSISANFTNVYDGSSAWSVASIGHRISFENLARLGKQVKLEMGIQLANFASAVSVQVRLVSQNATVMELDTATASTNGDGLFWITGFASPQTVEKYDLQVKRTGTGDTPFLLSASIWPYEGTP